MDEMIGKTVPIRQMNNIIWVKYKWVNVQTYADPEPIYLCVGWRDIAEMPTAAKEFDVFMETWPYDTK